MQKLDLYNTYIDSIYFSEQGLLQMWIEQEIQLLDLSASWIELLDTYRTLGFTDPISDADRIREFKAIVSSLNTSFMGKIGKDLVQSKNLDSALDYINTRLQKGGAEANKILDRVDVTTNFYKLQQLRIWGSQIARMIEDVEDMRKRKEEDGE